MKALLRRPRAFGRLTAITCLLAVMPLAVQAQETTGTIFGILEDSTGQVLSGVKVVIVSARTGQSRETVTDSTGKYSVALPIGDYEVSFQLSGVGPFTVRKISLHLNDRLVVNGKLSLGLVETLTVTAERLVQPTASVQTLIAQDAIRELPLLTRTPIQLVTLVPGVSSDLREDACFCDQGNLDISIHGARRSAVNWLLDGASNVNGWNNYTLVVTPSLDAIQEINVITSSYSAEWARNGGGVVNTVTKSGSSRFSGTAYHFFRNDGLNANSFFRNMDPEPEINSEPPRLRYNNFGYTVGGPVVPSRRNLFFFFSGEMRRSSRNTQPFETEVPDPLWLSDPASEHYVAPEARDANAVRLLTLWPEPNVPGTNTYRAINTSELDTRQEFGRADFNAGQNWTFVGRYLRDRVDSRGDYTAGPRLAPGHRYLLGQLAVGEARLAGARFLHEISYQLSRHRLAREDILPTKAATGVSLPELFPENRGNLIPDVWIAQGLHFLGAQQPRPRDYLNHTFNSSVTFDTGAHMLKAGGLVALERMQSNLLPEQTQGLFIFGPGGGFTAFQNFLRGNADGACGDFCSYSETDVDGVNRFRTGRYEAFVQDTWRLHPTVTLDLGLRYTYYPPLTDANDRLFTFSPAAYDPGLAPATTDPFGSSIDLTSGDRFNGMLVAGADSPFGRNIYPADTNNLQPRAGVAWDPVGSGRLIVRAGYGVYFDQVQFEMFAEGSQFSSFTPFRTDVIVPNASLSNPADGPAPIVWPKSQELLFQQGEPQTAFTPSLLVTSADLVAPRWQHWNIGLQRRLYSGGAIDAGYIGSRGDHLLRYVNVNRPQPEDLTTGARLHTVRPFAGYQRLIVRESTAKSRYHALATSWHHTHAGLSATVNYTLSRNTSDATYDNSAIDDPQNPLDKGAEFAAALTDRSHIFNASYIYRLPFDRLADGGWRHALLEGWQLAGITRIESGPAARIGGFNCNHGRACLRQRPDQIGDPAAGDQDGLQWIDPAAFTPSAAGEYGNAPVAPFRLPGRHQWDFSIAKDLRVAGSARLQFRVELINAFNHTQFLDVDTSCRGFTTCAESETFGRVMSTRPPREIQLGVRLDW